MKKLFSSPITRSAFARLSRGDSRDSASAQERVAMRLLRLRGVLAFALASAAAGLLIAATFIPINGGGRSGYSERIYDSSAPRSLQLFALEPVGVAVVAFLVALMALVAPKLRTLAAGVLLAFGVQTGLLFAAYFGGAAFGNPEFNSFEAGSALGLLAAVLFLLAGAVSATARERRGIAAFTGRRR